jgi:hypothetical protein
VESPENDYAKLYIIVPKIVKARLQNKRLIAACNQDYLTKLLFESPKRQDDAGVSTSANISSV